MPQCQPVSTNPFESALRIAREAATRCETWLEFQRTLFGTQGLLRQHFVDDESMEEFLQLPEFFDVSQVVAFRPLGISVPSCVALPEQLDRQLSAESAVCGLTVEQLCLAKLAASTAEANVAAEVRSCRRRASARSVRPPDVDFAGHRTAAVGIVR